MGGGCQVRGRGAVGRVGDHRFVVISAVTDLLLLLLLLWLLLVKELSIYILKFPQHLAVSHGRLLRR